MYVTNSAQIAIKKEVGLTISAGNIRLLRFSTQAGIRMPSRPYPSGGVWLAVSSPQKDLEPVPTGVRYVYNIKSNKKNIEREFYDAIGLFLSFVLTNYPNINNNVLISFRLFH
jgi:hypothetical protein